MRIKILSSFSDKLVEQIEFIAIDKIEAAKKFKIEILSAIQSLNSMPYKHRKSIYFENNEIRDLIFKGYTIVYRIQPKERVIEVFGLIKHQNNL